MATLARAPENTLPAFQRALLTGADGVELDVRLTRDDQLVVFHDPSVDRTSNGQGRVREHTLAEVRSLDVGSWFSPDFTGEKAPILDEVFELLPQDYLINVELKVVIRGMKLIAHLVAETIARHRRWASTLVASFNPVALYHLRRFEPRIARGYIWSNSHPYPIRARWLSPLVQADWYDPANDSYNLKLHPQFATEGPTSAGLGPGFRVRPEGDGVGAPGSGGYQSPCRDSRAKTRVGPSNCLRDPSPFV